MKNLLILSFVFPLVFMSCNKDPDPESEVKRAYCYLYNFVQGLENVVWEGAGSELPEAQLYSSSFPASVILQEDTEEILFAVKRPVSKDVLISYIVPLEKNAYYNVVAGGTAENPEMIINKIDTKNRPASGNVKFQILHAITGQNPIDVYMGGTTPEKRVVSSLDYFELSDPFETSDYDARSAIVVTKHSETYEQDSVLLNSIYNEDIISGASHFGIVAPLTFQEGSDLKFWVYSVPLE
jgi:hypothetical protein